MMRTRIAIVTASTCALLLLVGCGGGERQGGAPGGEAATGDTAARPGRIACNEMKPPFPAQTPDVAKISLLKGEVSVDPDPMVQPRGPGAFRWKLAEGQDADRFEVNFKDGATPLPKEAYAGSGQGAVGDRIDRDARCGIYEYGVTVWPKDGGDPVTLDPRVQVIPG